MVMVRKELVAGAPGAGGGTRVTFDSWFTPVYKL